MKLHERMGVVNNGCDLAHPQFFVLAEDLGKFLSGLHKARSRMDEVTGLR